MANPIVLCVLDGWGVRGIADNNAIRNANPSCFNFLNEEFPSTNLIASGLVVGLPEGQMGNSEVGHMTIGSGRMIQQDLVKINNELDSVLQQDKIKNLIANLRQTKKSCHLIGLVSDGGVHSHIEHLISIAKHLTNEQVKVKLHLITDGRDSAPTCGDKFIKHLYELSKTTPLLSISTISGRHFAMDRDKRFDRTEKAFKAVSCAEGASFDDPVIAISLSYASGKTDEFMDPQVHEDYKGIEDGDAVIFCNFRSDRIQQLCNAFLDPDFSEFKRDKVTKFSKAITLTSYSKKLEAFTTSLFQRDSHKNTLFDVLNSHNFSFLRIAETEKYAHITYFFDTGKEIEYSGEKRILIPSPKVFSYNHKPEMSAKKITSVLLSELKKNKHDFILLNYANPDMVGHTGDYLATIKAVKVVDDCLEKLYNAIVKKMDGTLILVGDHGNAEYMGDKELGSVHTAHTTNPVPFVIVSEKLKNNSTLHKGSLADVAPTILSILGIQKPKEMSGRNLLNYEKKYADV